MKIAVSGKGGVGKTTLSAMLAGALALKQKAILAIDADPDSNLGSALGVPPDEAITPLAEMHDLIAERTGAEGGYGGYFKLNPKVEDIPEDYARRIGTIRLLVLGGIRKGGGGCICPASALVRALLTHLILGRDDALIMDMEAGIEHLGRATAQSMDALVLVVNPGRWSLQTARRVRQLSADIGLTRLFAVANRVDDDATAEAIGRDLGDIPLIGRLPEDPQVAEPLLRPDDGAVVAGAALARHLPAVEAILGELERRI